MAINSNRGELGSRECAFGLGLDAVGADFDALAVNAGPLEVWVALGLHGRIIMTAQKDACSRHRWFFTAHRASSHNDCYITLKLLVLQGMSILTIFGLVVFIYSVVIHEVSHGLAAQALGDDTAERMGRLSLNPLKHIDIFG